MEFLKQNYINTTTQIAVTSNPDVASNIYNRNLAYQYYTDGFNNDNTTASITITLEVPMNISRIALLEKNLSMFRLFYNGVTANEFVLQGTDTVSSAYLTNAEDHVFFRCNTQSCNSVTLDMYKTTIANQEKVFSLLVLSDFLFTLIPSPSAQNYNPTIVPKQVVHAMSDGGTRIQNISKKWANDIKINYADETMKDSLEDLWNSDSEFNFASFGTSTGWDGALFEAVWPGPFEFYEFSDNAIASGFSGAIRLRETPT